MQPDLKSYLSLRTRYLIAWLLLWNVGLIWAPSLDREPTTGNFSLFGFGIIFVILSATTVASFRVATDRELQGLVVAPERATNFKSGSFVFAGFITSVLAIVVLAASAYTGVKDAL